MNIRAIEKENETADRFAKDGYEIAQNPKVPGNKKPDYEIEGRIFDNYAPTTGSVRSIWTTVEGKVLAGQTTRVVLNLTDSPVDVAALKAQFEKWPIQGLEEVIAVTKTSIERIWP